jgi:hypothetical protein
MPGYTQTDIANLALSHLGDRRINDIEDTNDTNAEIVADNYLHAVDFVFESHEWRWALKQAQLALLPTTPVVRYAYQYSLPSHFARLANLSDSALMYPLSDEWDIIDQKLMTNLGVAYCEYVSSHWDESIWPAFFAEPVSVKLAALCAPRVSHSLSSRADLEDKFIKQILPAARVTDSQWQPARKRFIRSEWRQQRFARGPRNRPRPDIS